MSLHWINVQRRKERRREREGNVGNGSSAEEREASDTARSYSRRQEQPSATICSFILQNEATSRPVLSFQFDGDERKFAEVIVFELFCF